MKGVMLVAMLVFHLVEESADLMVVMMGNHLAGE